jgi:hypothetical protein
VANSDSLRAMGKMSEWLFQAVLSVSGVACLIIHEAGAQDPPPGAAVENVVRAIQEARSAGLSMSQEQESAYLAAVAQGERRSKEMFEELEFRPGDPVDPNAPTATPLSHVRGKEGVQFPPTEEVILKPLPTPTAGPAPTELPVWSPEPYTRPSRCQTNETKRVVWNEKASEPENKVLNDILFVEKGLIPLDPEESFGKTPRLMPYETPLSKGSLINMEIYAVPCVPYRVRMSNVAYYYDQGHNALKNYDGDPKGKGKLSDIIQRKLFGEPQPKTRGKKYGAYE